VAAIDDRQRAMARRAWATNGCAWAPRPSVASQRESRRSTARASAGAGTNAIETGSRRTGRGEMLSGRAPTTTCSSFFRLTDRVDVGM